MMYLDLDELDHVLSLSNFWSRSRWALARFKREDYWGAPNTPLKDAIQQRITEATGEVHQGAVRMLANVRYFGFSINPIVCYYCFDQQENLQYLVAEVHSTPWGERIAYVLPCDPDENQQRISFDKAMHVSPFNPMNMQYQWQSNLPDRDLNLSIALSAGGEQHMTAGIKLEKQSITTATLNKILWQYPLMTLKTAAAIYWQAMKLWIKRIPIYSHPKHTAVHDDDKISTYNP